MVFISNGSKMDSCPDNIQNSMIPLRGDYGIFNVQNFQIPNKLVLFFFQHSFSCDTNQVTLNCLEGSVYISAYQRLYSVTLGQILVYVRARPFRAIS